MSWLTGSKGKTRQLPTMSGGQENFFNQFLSMLSGQGGQGFGQAMEHLQGLLSGSPQSYQAFEAPIKRQFAEQTLPQLQERLTGMGAGGGRSSGAAQVLGQAGNQLSEQLASMRGGLQQNAIQQLLNTFLQGSQQALGTKTFGYEYEPGSPGLLGYAAGGLGQGIGGGLGGGIGDMIRSLFGGR
jgi:hypothetical protein